MALKPTRAQVINIEILNNALSFYKPRADDW